MKLFFKKIFFWENPAAGAIFSSMMSVLSTFCIANLTYFNKFFCFLSYGIMVLPDLQYDIAAYIPLLLQLLFGLYSLFLFLRFFHFMDKSRFRAFVGVQSAKIALWE